MDKLLAAGKNCIIRSEVLISPYKLANRCFYVNKSRNQNYYDTLNITSSATQAEIKKAYYDLTLKYHPDRNEGSAEAAIKFREVTEAYEILGSYVQRKRYDKGMPLLPEAKPIKKSVTPHTVKYQKFFDSRISQTGASTSFGKVYSQNLSKQEQETDYCRQPYYKNPPKAEQPTSGVVFVLLSYFSCVFIYKNYM